jgi:hypothetical protein
MQRFLGLLVCLTALSLRAQTLMPLAQSDARTKALVDRVTNAYGGAERLARIHSMFTTAQTTSVTMHSLYVLPDRVWMRVDGKTRTWFVVTPLAAWIKSNEIPSGAAMKMPDEDRNNLLAPIEIEPLLVIAHRNFSTTRFAAGESRIVNGVTIDTLLVRVRQFDAKWSIDANGHVLSVARGELTTDYEDWRAVQGINVPFKSNARLPNGERQSITLVSCEFDRTVDEAKLFDTPKFWYDPKIDLAKTWDPFLDISRGFFIYRGQAWQVVTYGH